MRKTKIICTLGPACRQKDVLARMMDCGMNVARLNFSHQNHEFHTENIRTLKALREEKKLPLALLLDTKGPEIRTGVLEHPPVSLQVGAQVVLTSEKVLGNSARISVSSERLAAAVTSGNKILLDDGKITLLVEAVEAGEIFCRVAVGGTLGNTRGVNVPNVHIEMPFLSEQDKEDLRLGIREGVDFVAASFVRNAEDVIALRDFLTRNGGEDLRIIAKIENQSALDDFDRILSLADGIMVARGDMGVEIPFEQLPAIQKQLVQKSYQCGKPAVIATQMLESMIENPAPTRAEINDVATAVFEACSAVMLSGETAIGRDPAAVVAAMARICARAEEDAVRLSLYPDRKTPQPTRDRTEAICTAAVTAAEVVAADAIIAVTHSGLTARTLSGRRPEIPLIGATDNPTVFHQLALNWGVVPLLTKTQSSLDRLLTHVTDCALSAGLLQTGNRAVITVGAPIGSGGNTNALKIIEIEG